jgi:hypothetical protein
MRDLEDLPIAHSLTHGTRSLTYFSNGHNKKNEKNEKNQKRLGRCFLSSKKTAKKWY